jgi:hypothetical protein
MHDTPFHNISVRTVEAITSNRQPKRYNLEGAKSINEELLQLISKVRSL